MSGYILGSLALVVAALYAIGRYLQARARWQAEERLRLRYRAETGRTRHLIR